MRYSNRRNWNKAHASACSCWPVRVGVVCGWFGLLACLFLAGCAKESSNAAGGKEEQTQAESEETLASVELGEFRIQEPRPIENQKIDLRFTLRAVVEQSQQAQLEQLVALHQHAIRNQIILAVRSAESPEFDEPQLARLRHRILLRLSPIVGDPRIKDLYITDFRCQFD